MSRKIKNAFILGPRMVLEIIRIFDGPFSGAILFDNPDYESPNALRKRLKIQAATKYDNRLSQKRAIELKEEEFEKNVRSEDPIGDEVFDTSLQEALLGKSAHLLKKEIMHKRKKRKIAKK